MTKYQKGYQFELKVRKFLESKKECIFVFRSAGSKGPFDLIAFFKDKVYLIQCKYSYMPKKEAEELLRIEGDICNHFDCFEILIAQPQKSGRSLKVLFQNLSGVEIGFPL